MDGTRLGGTWRSLLVVLVVVIGGCNEGGGDSDAGPQQFAEGTGTAVLSWTPPVANSDGSPVDLLGFMIYVGSSPQNLHAVRMVSAIDTTVLIDKLPVGTLYFAVTAVSIGGSESALSNIESKTIG